MKALTKKQRESILARIDNYLLRIPREMNGCIITEGDYHFELAIRAIPKKKETFESRLQSSTTRISEISKW